MSQISIKIVTAENAFDLLREDWRRLFAETENAPFLSWEWLSVWYKWCGAGKTPFIVTAYRDDLLIGLLPLALEETKIFGKKLRRLSFLGEKDGGADYLDVIARLENKTAVLEAVFAELKKENCFDLLCLENLESDSTTLGFLLAFSEENGNQDLRYSRLTTEICPKINLDCDWTTFLKRSKRADNFKRRLKKLEKMTDFEFRTVTAPDECAAAFERFYQLHEKRWRQNGGSALSGHPRLVGFQRDLMRPLAEADLLRFDEIWVEGECRSSVYALENKQTFYYYNSGYDLDWANYSVGLVLIGLSIKSAIERGNNLYDFLRGQETYKFDWADHQTELVTAHLNRKSFFASAHEAKDQAWINLRDFSKNALPVNFVNSLKNRRRQWKKDYRPAGIKLEKTSEVV